MLDSTFANFIIFNLVSSKNYLVVGGGGGVDFHCPRAFLVIFYFRWFRVKVPCRPPLCPDFCSQVHRENGGKIGASRDMPFNIHVLNRSLCLYMSSVSFCDVMSGRFCLLCLKDPIGNKSQDFYGLS